jgi:hypothetical protein
MKLKILVVISLLLHIFLWAGLETEIFSESVIISGSFKIDDRAKIEEILDSETAMIPHYSRLLNLPTTGNWQLKSLSYETEEISLKGSASSEDEWFPSMPVTIGDPVIMRHTRFSQVAVSSFLYNKERTKIRLLKNVYIELELANSEINRKQDRGAQNGSSFDRLATAGITGHSPSRTEMRGSYLFICPDNEIVVNTLGYLKEWKQKLGFEAEIVTLSETGETNSQIKDYLQNAYDTWEVPPEFVVLVGDVNGNIQLPSWYIAGYMSPYCVTDHPYTLLEGDDYFPDIMIGRFSVQNLSQLQTIVSKVINYESAPVESNDWTRRAIMLSYVIDVGNYAMYSQRETVMAVREKLLDFTYTEVDTFISPWQTGASNLINHINSGYSFINYRGAGSPVYWSGGYGHMFTLWNIGELGNGFMLPMVTSIVCGGGDFAYGNYDTSFGEEWLAAGSPANPRGAIGFIGPSELDTKTPFNNCLDLGIYQGITQEGIFGCAAMMLRGKMELYNNYPGCHQMDGSNDALDSDMFYFYVYNLLGDPGLKIWTDEIKHYELEMPDNLPLGSSYYSISLSGSEIEGHTLALTSEGELISTSSTNAAGWVAVEIPANLTDFEVTLSGYGYVPITQNVQIIDEGIISLEGYELTQQAAIGETIGLTLELANLTGNFQNNLEIMLSSSDQQISISPTEIIVPETDISQIISLEYEIELADTWRSESEIRLDISINNGELGTHYIFLDTVSPQVEFAGFSTQNPQNCLLIGEENAMVLELYNSGTMPSSEFIVILATEDGKCQLLAADCAFANIGEGETEMAVSSLSLIPAANLIAGEPARFSLTVIQSSIPVWQTTFSIPVGMIDENSSTFSEYGYYATESRDLGNIAAPQYDWIEIAEPEGGAGILLHANHVTSDGFSTRLDLPFQFCFYGSFYDEATISSSGWLAMGDEEFVFFRNRTIPSGVGPKAMIAPFWDFLSDGEIYTYYDENAHYFIIEWHNFRNDNLNNIQTFQVILYDPEYHVTATGDAKIKFQYKEISNLDQEGNYATIGIENYSQTEGLLLSFANLYPATMHEIASETAIMISIKEGIIVPRISANVEELHITIAADTTASYSLELSNSNEQLPLNYELSASHFPRDPEIRGGKRDLSGNSINAVNQTYFSGHEMDLYAFMIHDPQGGEAVHGVQMDFPDRVQINSATNLGNLLYNEQTGSGATVTWGYGNGEDYNGNTPQTFHIYLEVMEGTAPLSINWQIDGDGNGEEPHSVSGIITLMPSDDSYIWVVYPNGGEQLAYGLSDTIRWNSYGEIGDVNIDYSRNNFLDFQIIAEGAANTGSYEWSVPWELTETAKIRVRNISGSQYDISDASFAIKGLVITHPNSETVLEYGTPASVTWDYAGSADCVNIEYSNTAGIFWETFASNLPNTGYYEFTVELTPCENYKIRLIAEGEETIISEMAGTFSVVDVPVNWLIFPENFGNLEPGGMASHSFIIDTEGLTSGEYLSYITLRTNYNQKLIIPVHLTIPNLEEEAETLEIPAILKANYPNPFSNSDSRGNGTEIEFNLTKENRVKLAIYNIRGQLIRVLIDEKRGVGNYRLHWDGKNQEGLPLAAGVYFYQLMIDSKMVAAKKCLLFK